MDNSNNDTEDREWDERSESGSVSVISMKTYCSSTTIDSNESLFCRICHQNETSDITNAQMISPCNCTGSMANVHRQCLQRWSSLTASSSCDVCGFKYKCRKRYPNISNWIRVGINRKEFRVEVVIAALLFISSLLTIGGSIASLLALEESPSNSILYEGTRAPVYCLWALTIFGCVFYSIMLVYEIRYLYMSFTNWRNNNWITELVWNEDTVETITDNYI